MSPKQAKNNLPPTGRPLREIISEEEFLGLVHNAASDILRITLFLVDSPGYHDLLNKKLFYVIAGTARILEDFLDDHGAKNNRNWCFIRELVASARGFGVIGYLVEYIEKRYNLEPEDQKNFHEFFVQTQKNKAFFGEALIFILRLLRQEAERLKISLPPKGLSESYYYDIPSDKILPHTLEEGEIRQEQEHIVKIASNYLNIIKDFEALACTRAYAPEELDEMIPAKINEENVRKFELSMHNLESVYDTYVKDTALEAKDAKLDRLRIHISMVLHILQIARALAHFYERHESINRLLEKAVTTNSAPNCIVNWALYYTNQIMHLGGELANQLLKEYTALDSIELPIPKDLGFHLRPATLVAKVVNHYGSNVYMLVGKDKFEADSILSITWAGGKIAREKIDKITFIGDKRVLEDLKILASVNYGEDYLGKDRPLPKELSYLR